MLEQQETRNWSIQKLVHKSPTFITSTELTVFFVEPKHKQVLWGSTSDEVKPVILLFFEIDALSNKIDDQTHRSTPLNPLINPIQPKWKLEEEREEETRPNPIKQRSIEARGRKIYEMRERESCEPERVERREKQILK